MTCNERIEQLLNRAGQTISDLPKSDGKHLTYDRESRSSAEHGVFAYAKQSGYVDVIDCLAMHQDYILHLTDVIDRMETALENVCGERDYFRQFLIREAPCMICVNGNLRHLDEPCSTCLNKNDVSFFECEGVPENWRADND